MIEKKLTIINKLGLHARAAAKMINTTSRFSSRISLAKGTQEADGKSIMSVMMLAASQGTELQVKVEGSDQEDAMQAIEALISNRFDEAE